MALPRPTTYANLLAGVTQLVDALDSRLGDLRLVYGTTTLTTAAGWSSTTITLPSGRWQNEHILILGAVSNTTGANLISWSCRRTGNTTFYVEWNLATSLGTTLIDWLSIGR